MTLKPMKNSQKFQRPSALAQHPAGELGKPVVERAEERKHGAADQHVVQMRDDEIGVVHLQVERHGAEHEAGQAAEHEDEEEREHEQQRRLQVELARSTAWRSSRRSGSPTGSRSSGSRR